MLLNITMAKSFFGRKYLMHTECRHKKSFSLTLMVSRGKNCSDPKSGPEKVPYFFSLQIYLCYILLEPENMLISKMNVTLALFLMFSCYFMKSMDIKMEKFRIFYKKFALKLSIGLSYNKQIKEGFLTVCSYHVMYVFQIESTLYICLNFKKLLARNRCNI